MTPLVTLLVKPRAGERAQRRFDQAPRNGEVRELGRDEADEAHAQIHARPHMRQHPHREASDDGGSRAGAVARADRGVEPHRRDPQHKRRENQRDDRDARRQIRHLIAVEELLCVGPQDSAV